MAKKKQDVAPIEDEIMVEEVEVEEAPIEESPVEEVVEQKAKKEVDIDAFIARKLKVINEMPNKAKAKAMANRLFRHKENK